MNYCFFEEISEQRNDEPLEGRRGIIAATDTELCLIEGTLNKASGDKVLKIPYSEISGVNYSLNQIQIKRDDQRFVLFLYYWSDQGTDRKRASEFYQLLASKNVPNFEPEALYSLSRFDHPKYPHAGYSQRDLGPTNYDASLQAIQSHENRYDVWDPVRLTNESK